MAAVRTLLVILRFTVKQEERVSIIQKIRHHSAQKIQRAWKYFMMIRVWPAMLEDMQQKASLLLQSRMKGYLARKHIEQELNVHRMESCF